VKKKKKKKKEIEPELLQLTSKEKKKGDILVESAKILKTQKEHVFKTVQRFIDELKA
jgi:hypothetical protein